MEFINCTARTIHLRRQDGVVIHLDPSPAPIRLVPQRGVEHCIQGIAVCLGRFSDCENLPPHRRGALLICEPDVALILAGLDRWDAVTPDEIVEDGLYPVYGGLLAWDCTEEVALAPSGSITNQDAEHYLEN